MIERSNQPLDRMTKSAVSRMFQSGGPWRAPRHRLAWRSATEKRCPCHQITI
jgi:hypothetical protein